LAGTVILNNPAVPIYLSIFIVRRFSPLQTAGQPADAWRSVFTDSVYGQTAGVRNIFRNALHGCH